MDNCQLPHQLLLPSSCFISLSCYPLYLYLFLLIFLNLSHLLLLFLFMFPSLFLSLLFLSLFLMSLFLFLHLLPLTLSKIAHSSWSCCYINLSCFCSYFCSCYFSMLQLTLPLLPLLYIAPDAYHTLSSFLVCSYSIYRVSQKKRSLGIFGP